MRKLLVIGGLFVVAGGVALLCVAAPGPGSFYPPCLFHLATGLHCPGCGATRCLHALLHGDLPQAVAYNPLLLLALPFMTVWSVRLGYELWTGRHIRRAQVPSWCLRALIVGLVAFWVLRNLPFEPFFHLAPHALTTP